MFHVYTVVGGASLVAYFFSIASCQLTSIVTNQDFQIKSIPSPTLFRIVLCHKLDVHAGFTIHVKIVLLNSCGFVEPASFVFSGEKSKPCDFNQTWKQALSRALYCALWCPAE